MLSYTFQIVEYFVAYPLLPDPRHEWYWWGSIRLYASIECHGAAGEKLTIYYLRPDTAWPIPGEAGPQNTYDPSTQQASIYRFAWEYRHHCRMLAGSNPVYAYLDTTYPMAMRIYSEFSLLPATAASVPDVIGWLNNNSLVASKLWWGEPGGVPLQFPRWSQQQQQDLAAAFGRAWNYETIPWNDKPPEQIGRPDEAALPLLAENDAWTIYTAYLGHMLAVEIGARVPWSILSYSPEQLRSLFGLFSTMDNGYWLTTYVIPASPPYTYSFLVNNNIIGASRLETITNLLDWCRNNMWHFWSNDISETWGYNWPRVQGTIEGTTDTASPHYGAQCYTAGCTGTTGFLQAVLLAANIPVEQANADGHSTPHFLTEDAYLSHGDDPYDILSKATHPFLFIPMQAPDDLINHLLIDAATYSAWFGPTVPESEQENNVARQTAELAIQFFPDYLLHYYWLDKQANLTPPAGKVYERLGRYFPLDTIISLWPAMEKRLSNFGGLFWRLTKPGPIVKPPKPPKPAV